MYLKSLVVFVLCTVFVLGFVVVLNYEAGAVGRHPIGVGGATTTLCGQSEAPCESLSITTAKLTEENYSGSLLGPGSYAALVLGLNASGSFPIESITLFIDNTSAGTLQGPFLPGTNQVLSLTLPANISVSPGQTYNLSIEGFYGGSYVIWKSIVVTAE